MNEQQRHLRDVLLPRFNEIKTPPDVALVLFHHVDELTTDEAVARSLWRGSDRLKDRCGRVGFGRDKATRTCSIVTDSEAARHCFVRLAEEAGECLGEWAIVRGIDGDTISVEKSTRWMFGLFDLAISGRIPTNVQRVAFDGDATGGLGFYCDIRDAVRASCYAIDYLTAADNKLELREQFSEQCWRLRLAKFHIFRDAFPWFAPAMEEIEFDVFRAEKDTEESRAVWRKADDEWCARVGLKRLDTMQIESWQAVAVAAGFPLADVEQFPLRRLIRIARQVTLGTKSTVVSPTVNGIEELVGRLEGAGTTGGSIPSEHLASIVEIPAYMIRTGNAKEQGDNQTSIRLLNVFTNGLADERLDKASRVLDDDKLTVDEKLWKIDELMRIPPTVSAENLGKALGVSKTAVQKTTWYIKNRKGQKDNEISSRQEQHRQRGQQYEPDRQPHDD